MADRVPEIRNFDFRNVPRYTSGEASRYLKIPASTVAAWSRGTTYSRGGETVWFEPVIEASHLGPLRLSFTNLVEVHVLAGLRRGWKLKLDEIRNALEFVREKLDLDRPLIHEIFKTDGVRLFVEHLGELVCASRPDQPVFNEIIRLYLERVEVDEDGIARRLYPFTRREPGPQVPNLIAIDPEISFGRPFIRERGIPTLVVAQRYFGGDSVQLLAEDYECPPATIEEAIRCEREFREAA